MSIIAEAEKVIGTGTTAEIVAKKMSLKSEEFPADFTEIAPEVGEVKAFFESELKLIPEGVRIKIRLDKTPPPEVKAGFEEAAAKIKNEVVEVAYVLVIDKVNLENEVHLGKATITMEVGKAWADSYGKERIRIFRYTYLGESEILPTTFRGYEADRAIFEATTPDGLSIFGLVALAIPPPPPINWALIIGGIIGGLVIIALLVYISWLRRKRA